MEQQNFETVIVDYINWFYKNSFFDIKRNDIEFSVSFALMVGRPEVLVAKFRDYNGDVRRCQFYPIQKAFMDMKGLFTNDLDEKTVDAVKRMMESIKNDKMIDLDCLYPFKH